MKFTEEPVMGASVMLRVTPPPHAGWPLEPLSEISEVTFPLEPSERMRG